MATQIQRRRRRRRIRRRKEEGFNTSSSGGFGVGDGISETQKLLVALLGPMSKGQGQQRSPKQEDSDGEREGEEEVISHLSDR